MNCGSICHKVTTIRRSLSYHYNYIWLVTVTRSPVSVWSPPVVVIRPNHSPERLIPIKHSPPQESTPSEHSLEKSLSWVLQDPATSLYPYYFHPWSLTLFWKLTQLRKPRAANAQTGTNRVIESKL